VGLDPHGIREIKAVIAGLKQSGCALLISTHMIESMEDNWDTTYILKDGKVSAVCRRGEMPQGQSLEDIYFAITEGPAAEGPGKEGGDKTGVEKTGGEKE
jgi:ABC-type multidrug transport system ATPase subunit